MITCDISLTSCFGCFLASRRFLQNSSANCPLMGWFEDFTPNIISKFCCSLPLTLQRYYKNLEYASFWCKKYKLSAFFGNSTMSKIFSFLFIVPNDSTISSFLLSRSFAHSLIAHRFHPSSVSGTTIFVYFVSRSCAAYLPLFGRWHSGTFYSLFCIHFRDHLATILNVSVGCLVLFFYLVLFTTDLHTKSNNIFRHCCL